MNNEDTTPRIIDIILDECESSKAIECIMKQGDLNSRFIIAQLVKNQIPKVIPDGASVQVFVLKPDDTEVYAYCEVLDKEDGIIKIPLTQQALALAGDIYFEVLISWTVNTVQHKLSYPLVKVPVSDSIWDNNVIESQPEFSALIEALAKVEALEKRILYMETIIENSIIIE